MEKQTKATRQKTQRPDWQGIFDEFLHNIVLNLTAMVTNPIREQVRNFYQTVQKNFYGNLFFLIGIIFLFVGAAILVNDLLGISQGIGYALVGLLSLIIGLIVVRN